MLGHSIRADCAGEVGLIGPIESRVDVDSTSTTSCSVDSAKLKTPPPATQYLTDFALSGLPSAPLMIALPPTCTPRIEVESDAGPFAARQAVGWSAGAG